MNSEFAQAGTYCDALNDVRVRLDVVRAICRAEITVGSEQFDSEVIALNFRKILEHIAFGSLTANRAVYEAARPDIQTIWRAKDVLSNLEKIHKDFYPRALQPPSFATENGVRHVHFEDLPTGFLTRSEFVDLYTSCNGYLHSQNPFSSASNSGFGHTPLEWADKITMLLRFHLFRLHGLPKLWLGELQGPDGRAHVSIASAI